MEAAAPRVVELREALEEMRGFAERLGTAEAHATTFFNTGEMVEGKSGRQSQSQVRQHAAEQMGKLAADMLTYDRIEAGKCL